MEDAKGLDQVNGRTPVRFMPFSMGGRDCVGQTLAKLNLATTLAQLYGNFSFRLADEVRGVPYSYHPLLISYLCPWLRSGRGAASVLRMHPSKTARSDVNRFHS